MKKLFISQPMRGKSNDEIKQVRNEALVIAHNITNDDVTLIDSFFEDAPVDANPLWYLGKSIELMAEADYVYFADCWWMARGCRIEHECAVQYGLTIIKDSDYV